MGRAVNLVLDTCALLWLTLDPSSLSPRAHKAISEADHLTISSISVWEVGVKWKSGKIDLGTNYEDYISRVTSCSDFVLMAVDARMWAKSILLPWEHRDPADRVIVALAQDLDATIITADKEIAKFYKRCLA